MMNLRQPSAVLKIRVKSVGFCTGLAGLILVVTPRVVRGDDSITYKYEDYSEGDGRMKITTQSALLEQDLGTDMHIKVHGVIDAIAGATPNGQPAPTGSDQVPITEITDHRKAWDADFSRQFSGINVDVGVANSRESDYASTGWSINTLSDFNEKNTTLLIGGAGTDDDVKVFYQAPWAEKHTYSAIAGVTQLIDPKTTATIDLSFGDENGFLSDQYKLVQKSIQVAPTIFLPFTFGENRPDHRTKEIVAASLNHSFAGLNAAIEGTYRFYVDSFGTVSNTVEASWFQHVGSKLLIIPTARFYNQSAANFYYYDLDKTNIVPVSGRPPTGGPFYSSDYRLSQLITYTVGMKAVLPITTHLELDAEYKRYEMRGTDGVTPQSAYPVANIVTVGGKVSW